LVLREDSFSKFQIPIHQYLSHELNNIAQVKDYVEVTDKSGFFSFFFDIINFFSRTITGYNLFQGFVIGIKTREIYVDVNSEVFILGRVFFDKATGNISI